MTATPGQVTAIYDDFGSSTTVDIDPFPGFQPRGQAAPVRSAPVPWSPQRRCGGRSSATAYPPSYPLAPAVSPNRGIGPEAVIASDNTLGNFSQFQGRLYVAFVGRSTASGNPTDNTDIYLVSSSNGGASWSGTVRVNQDNAFADGYSESNGTGTTTSTSGRPQFMPAVAVDQSTGTLVVSYLDARDDAARARYATYVTSSIDGGASYAPDTFVNTPQTAFDTITQQTVILGPIPDNQTVDDEQPEYGNAVLVRRQAGPRRRQRARLRRLVGRPERRRQRRESARHPGRAPANHGRPAGRQQFAGAGHDPDGPDSPRGGAVRDQRPRPGHRCPPGGRVLRAIRPAGRSRAR